MSKPRTRYHCAAPKFPRHILNAAKSLRDLDQKQVDAVSARIDLDLRTGYAFSRFLTTSLQRMGGPLQQATISYGTCVTMANRVQ